MAVREDANQLTDLANRTQRPLLRFLVMYHPDSIYAEEVVRSGTEEFPHHPELQFEERTVRKILERFSSLGLVNPTPNPAFRYHLAKNGKVVLLRRVSLRAIWMLLRSSPLNDVRQIAKVNPMRLPWIFESWSDLARGGVDVETQAAQLLSLLDPTKMPMLDVANLHPSAILENRDLWRLGVRDPEQVVADWLSYKFHVAAFGLENHPDLPAEGLLQLKKFLISRDGGVLYRHTELTYAEQVKRKMTFETAYWDLRVNGETRDGVRAANERVRSAFSESRDRLFEDARTRAYAWKRLEHLEDLSRGDWEVMKNEQFTRGLFNYPARKRIRLWTRYIQNRHPNLKLRLVEKPESVHELVEHDEVLSRIRLDCIAGLVAIFGKAASTVISEDYAAFLSSPGKVKDEDVQRILGRSRSVSA